ncbi:homeobox domain-containing protein [Spinellus fusiger]|nr:homeobox domain-containing protein [Spinellus fusiger]
MEKEVPKDQLLNSPKEKKEVESSGSEDEGWQTEVKTRHRFTSAQLDDLELFFKTHVRPSSEAKSVIAHKLGIQVSRVQVWLQNRRAKEKKAHLDTHRKRPSRSLSSIRRLSYMNHTTEPAKPVHPVYSPKPTASDPKLFTQTVPLSRSYSTMDPNQFSENSPYAEYFDSYSVYHNYPSDYSRPSLNYISSHRTDPTPSQAVVFSTLQTASLQPPPPPPPSQPLPPLPSQLQPHSVSPMFYPDYPSNMMDYNPPSLDYSLSYSHKSLHADASNISPFQPKPYGSKGKKADMNVYSDDGREERA